jgi:hypothetical protein
MRPETRRLGPELRLLVALPLLAALAVFLGSAAARDGAHSLAWSASYALAAAVVVVRVRRGEVLDPLVCLGGSYLALLAFGALLFERLRASALSDWTANAIGAGHAALWLGGFLAGRPRAR